MHNDTKAAKELLENGNYTCVFCKGSTVYTDAARGVKPLLSRLDSGVALSGFCAADKVVGKGAAFLYVLLGVRELYAITVSEKAADVLKAYGIKLYYSNLVPAIRNRTDTGPCPMEDAVRDIDVPEDAPAALRKRLAELASNHAKA